MDELRLLILSRYGTVRSFAMCYGASESMLSHILAGRKEIPDKEKFAKLLSIDVETLETYINRQPLTNKQKFEEIFGCQPNDRCPLAFTPLCNDNCSKCQHNQFWEKTFHTKEKLYE